MWLRIAAIGLGLAAAAPAGAQTEAGNPAPRLTALERSQGWRFLFDGADASAWRGYGQNRRPKNWTVAQGELRASTGPALATFEQFGDFELTFEWSVEEGGAAAAYFRVSEDFPAPGRSGLKLELAGPGVTCGGDGGLLPPLGMVRIDPGRWARVRVALFGNQVDCWVNGTQVQSYLIEGAEWRAAVAGSQPPRERDFGRLRAGVIVLEGDRAAFRAIKLRVTGAD